MEKIEKTLKFFTLVIIEIVNIVFLIPVAIICWNSNVDKVYELLFGKDL